jgi:hypothetical protein
MQANVLDLSTASYPLCLLTSLQWFDHVLLLLWQLRKYRQHGMVFEVIQRANVALRVLCFYSVLHDD